MLICPQCNAVNAVTVDAVRIACTRCGESFDPLTAEHSLERPTTTATSPLSSESILFSPKAWWISGGLASLILVVGLSITQPWGKKTVPRSSSTPNKLPVVVSPLGLSGLVHIPPSANIVAAFQPMPLLAHAAITKTNPKQLLLDNGVPEAVLQAIDRTGLPWDQIDHLVVGAGISNDAGKILPSISACLKLTRPIGDESGFLATLKAEKNSQQSKGGRTVYSISLGLPLLLTKYDDKTYLLGLDASDLLASESPIGGGHLSQDLRETMTTKLSPASFVFVATDSKSWHETPAAKMLGAMPNLKGFVGKLANGRAAAMGVSIESEPVMRIGVQLADATKAADMRSWLKSKFTNESTKLGGDDTWATVETPLDGKLKSIVTELMGQ